MLQEVNVGQAAFSALTLLNAEDLPVNSDIQVVYDDSMDEAGLSAAGPPYGVQLSELVLAASACEDGKVEESAAQIEDQQQKRRKRNVLRPPVPPTPPRLPGERWTYRKYMRGLRVMNAFPVRYAERSVAFCTGGR